MLKCVASSTLLILLTAGVTLAQQYDPGEEGTFSIIGRDPNTGQLGMAVHSKTIAVGSRTRGGKGGVAVIAHQSASNPMYSTIGVELLQAGMTPQQALDMMLRSDAFEALYNDSEFIRIVGTKYTSRHSAPESRSAREAGWSAGTPGSIYGS